MIARQPLSPTVVEISTCVLCRKAVEGRAHKRFIVLAIDAQGRDRDADEQACFCIPCARILSDAVAQLRAAADAGERRGAP